MIEQQKVVSRRVWPGLSQLLHDPETVRISRHVQAAARRIDQRPRTRRM